MIEPTRAPGGTQAAVGCLLVVPGFFGGGIIGVAIAKLIGEVRGCVPAEGLPACNHFEYLAVGALLGAVVLPAGVIWRMRSGARASRNSERS